MNFFKLSALDPGYKRGLALVIIAFVIVYIPILLVSDFIPYVMDNNESFSVLWHSYNLYNFDFFKSYGLADDSSSFTQDGHPFAHTHQGNFPRVFGYLIYVFGARTIESQITVTLFLVGLPSMIVAYTFLSRISSPLLATVTCLVLLTDYVNFTQWQVVTYRVWHTLFFFLMLALVRYYADEERRSTLVVAFVSAACLFYFEISFAIFIATATALYTFVIMWGRPKAIIKLGSAFSVGAVSAALILIGQLILYLGWDGFKQDLSFTYVARNAFGSAEYANVMQKIKDFYAEHDVAFWFNMYDASKDRSLDALIRYFFNDLNPHAPIFSTITLAIFLAWPFRRVADIAFKLRLMSDRRAAIWSLVALMAIPALVFVGTRYAHIFNKANNIAMACGVIVLAGWAINGLKLGETARRYASAFCLKATDYLVRHETRTKPVMWGLGIVLLAVVPALLTRFSGSLSVTMLIVVFSLLALWLFVVALNNDKGMAVAAAIGERPLHIVSGLAFVFSAMVFLSISVETSLLTAGHVALGDRARYLPGLSFSFALLLLIAVSFVARGRLLTVGSILKISDTRWLAATGYILLMAALLYSQQRLFDVVYEPIWVILSKGWDMALLGRVLMLIAVFFGCTYIVAPHAYERRSKTRFSEIFIIILVCSVGFIVSYMMFTGYILTGYLWRNVPFTVFFTSLTISVPVVMLISAAMRSKREHKRLSTHARAASAIVLLLFIGGFWGTTQYRWVTMLPADGASFLAQLREEPFKGKTFVGMGYMAPIAAMTGTWAYYEPNVEQGIIVEKDGEFEPAYSYDYLWFADRDAKDQYKKPEYFLCFMPTNHYILVNMWSGDCLSRGLSAGDFPIVKSSEFDHTNFNWELVAYDEEGKRENDAARWAIIRLDWQAPPRLKDNYVGVQVVKENAPKTAQGMWVEPIYQYVQKNWVPEGETVVRAYALGPVKKAQIPDMAVERIGNQRARVTMSPAITGSLFEVSMQVNGGDFGLVARLDAASKAEWVAQSVPEDAVVRFRVEACDGAGACKTYHSNVMNIPGIELPGADLSCFSGPTGPREIGVMKDGKLWIDNPTNEGVVISVRPASIKKHGREYYSEPFHISPRTGEIKKVKC